MFPYLFPEAEGLMAPAWRAALAFLAAFVLGVLPGGVFIGWLRRLQAIQYVRSAEGADAISLQQMHWSKKGTPTMGGLLMLWAVLAAVMLLGDFRYPTLWLALFGMLGCTAIGFLDDYLKCVMKNGDGLSPMGKIVGQTLTGAGFALGAMWLLPQGFTHAAAQEPVGPAFLWLPLAGDWVLPLGLLFVPLAIFVLTATSNAVNLTDGLDGLAAGTTLPCAAFFGLLAWMAASAGNAALFGIPVVQGATELSVLLGALGGACVAFLWYNSFPAQMFMGDTGSMMLGGALGSVALLLKQEVLLVLVGGVFVAEAVSVILQVGSYKLRKKRILRMAPLHHHFERGGMPENKIIARFWIVSALLAVAGLATLHLR